MLFFSRARPKGTPSLTRAKQFLFEKMAENGDLSRHSDTAPKKNLKQGEIDVRELQQKRHMAEMKRF